MAREYFKAFHSYLKWMEKLNFEERGRLFTALLQYSSTGEQSVLNGNEEFVFSAMQTEIDREEESYSRVCETNRKNGSKGGRPHKTEMVSEETEKTESVSEKPNAFLKTEIDKDKDKDKEKDKVKDKDKGVFKAPTLEEVKAYVREKGYSVDPIHFYTYFTEGNWKDSKGNQVKNWKQKLITWENHNTNKSGGVTDRSVHEVPDRLEKLYGQHIYINSR